MLGYSFYVIQIERVSVLIKPMGFQATSKTKLDEMVTEIPKLNYSTGG
jgi:hypothetical protein